MDRDVDASWFSIVHWDAADGLRNFVYQKDMSEFCRRRAMPSVFLSRQVLDTNSQMLHFTKLDLPYSCYTSIRTEASSNIIMVVQLMNSSDLLESCQEHRNQLVVYELGETYGGYWGPMPEAVMHQVTWEPRVYTLQHPDLQAPENLNLVVDLISDSESSTHTTPMGAPPPVANSEEDFVTWQVQLVNITNERAGNKINMDLLTAEDNFDFMYDVTPRPDLKYDTSLIPLMQFSVMRGHKYGLRDGEEPEYELEFNPGTYTPDHRLTTPIFTKWSWPNKNRTSWKKKKLLHRPVKLFSRGPGSGTAHTSYELVLSQDTSIIPDDTRRKETISEDTFGLIEDIMKSLNKSKDYRKEGSQLNYQSLLKNISDMHHNISAYLLPWSTYTYVPVTHIIRNLTKESSMSPTSGTIEMTIGLSSQVQPAKYDNPMWEKIKSTKNYKRVTSRGKLGSSFNEEKNKTSVKLKNNTTYSSIDISQRKTVHTSGKPRETEGLTSVTKTTEYVDTLASTRALKPNVKGTLVDHESWENVVQVAPILAGALNRLSPGAPRSSVSPGSPKRPRSQGVHRLLEVHRSPEAPRSPEAHRSSGAPGSTGARRSPGAPSSPAAQRSSGAPSSPGTPHSPGVYQPPAHGLLPASSAGSQPNRNQAKLSMAHVRRRRTVEAIPIMNAKPHPRATTRRRSSTTRTMPPVADSLHFAQLLEIPDDEMSSHMALRFIRQFAGAQVYNICAQFDHAGRNRHVVLLNSSRILLAISNFTIPRITVVMTTANMLHPAELRCPDETIECQVAGARVCIDSASACDGIPNCGAHDLYDEDRLQCGVTMGFQPSVCLAAMTFLMVILTMICIVHYWLNRCVPKVADAFFVYTDGAENVLFLDTIMRAPTDNELPSAYVYDHSSFEDNLAPTSMREPKKHKSLCTRLFSCCLRCFKRQKKKSNDSTHKENAEDPQKTNKEASVRKFYSFTELELSKIQGSHNKDEAVQTGESLEIAFLKMINSLSNTSPSQHMPRAKRSYMTLANEPQRPPCKPVPVPFLLQNRESSFQESSSSEAQGSSDLRFDRGVNTIEEEKELRSTLYDPPSQVAAVGSSRDMDTMTTANAKKRLRFEEHARYISIVEETAEPDAQQRDARATGSRPSLTLSPGAPKQPPRRNINSLDTLTQQPDILPTIDFKRFFRGKKKKSNQ